MIVWYVLWIHFKFFDCGFVFFKQNNITPTCFFSYKGLKTPCDIENMPYSYSWEWTFPRSRVGEIVTVMCFQFWSETLTWQWGQASEIDICLRLLTASASTLHPDHEHPIPQKYGNTLINDPWLCIQPQPAFKPQTSSRSKFCLVPYRWLHAEEKFDNILFRLRMYIHTTVWVGIQYLMFAGCC